MLASNYGIELGSELFFYEICVFFSFFCSEVINISMDEAFMVCLLRSTDRVPRNSVFEKSDFISFFIELFLMFALESVI